MKTNYFSLTILFMFFLNNFQIKAQLSEYQPVSATADSYCSSMFCGMDMPASRGIDNNNNTNWVSQVSPAISNAEFVVDLGQKQNVSRIILDLTNGKIGTNYNKVYTSTDNATWNLMTETCIGTAIKTFDFSATSCRYIKVEMHHSSPDYFSIAEFDVFGPIDATWLKYPEIDNIFHLDGKVGIGTDNPESKLDIVGSFNASGKNGEMASGAEISINDAEGNNGGSIYLLPGNGYSSAGNIHIGYNKSTAGITLEANGNMNATNLDLTQYLHANTVTADYGFFANKLEAKEIEVKEIAALSIKVEMNNLADYVFDDSYSLQPLKDVEKYISENKHLPGIPSAQEVKESGMDIGEMNNLLLQKIEELTLYIIELQKQIDDLNK